MNDLEGMLARLKAAQLELINTAARAGSVPTDRTLAKIADLELTIAAVEHAIDEAR